MGLCYSIPPSLKKPGTEMTEKAIFNLLDNEELPFPTVICAILVEFLMACSQCGQLEKSHTACEECKTRMCIPPKLSPISEDHFIIPRDSIRPNPSCKDCIEAAAAHRSHKPSLYSLNIYTAMIELGQSNVMPVIIIP
jgi:hypothetical protein